MSDWLNPAPMRPKFATVESVFRRVNLRLQNINFNSILLEFRSLLAIIAGQQPTLKRTVAYALDMDATNPVDLSPESRKFNLPSLLALPQPFLRSADAALLAGAAPAT
jgi:hypothetical protein